MLHIASTFVLLLVLLGVSQRHRPVRHISIMSLAFAIDLSLVLYLEITRKAVEQVATHVRPMVYLHAAISLGVLISYVVMIFLGRRVLKGRRASRGTHRNMGITFVVLRSLNYVTALVM